MRALGGRFGVPWHATPTGQKRIRLICRALQRSKVLLVGGGGREHALAWKLSQSPLCETLYCAPGNPGIGQEHNVELVPKLNLEDHAQVISFCKSNDIGLVFVGPEAALVDGIVDSLDVAGIKAFGPSKAAAQLEGSKVFMKNICKKYNIPSAFYETFTDVAAAKAYVEAQGAPIVIKTSGLAAGKGVIVAQTKEEAFQAIEDMLIKKVFGNAGSEIVIEEFLDGEEASFFALLDGSSTAALASAQDHKAAFDGDTGPNTGGMGAYSPAPVMTPDIEAQVMRDIVQATADAMVAEGIPFRGVLFAGLMIKNGKAKLLEHNVRFGDPECQGLLMRLKSDLLEVLLIACEGKLADIKLQWSDEAVMTVVYAAKGYPAAYKKGSVIRNLDKVSGAKVFHAGTSLNENGEVVATGGRVLGITALGADILQAQEKAYKAIGAIDWDDGFYRTDIGWRAVARLKQP